MFLLLRNRVALCESAARRRCISISEREMSRKPTVVIRFKNLPVVQTTFALPHVSAKVSDEGDELTWVDGTLKIVEKVRCL